LPLDVALETWDFTGDFLENIHIANNVASYLVLKITHSILL